MVTTSYPRYPGDRIGTFVEPIAHGVAALGHEVHVVLPWHPLLTRAGREGDIHFHPFRYAPVARLNVFGYADSLESDVRMRSRAYLAAPFALAAGWRAVGKVARETGATIVHGHWVIPSGVLASTAAGNRPVVISLHGSDVYVAERLGPARRAARAAFARADWVTACSDDLRNRAILLGSPADRSETMPYGVDALRFQPDAGARAELRQQLGVHDGPLVFTAGRFVRKKGFEHLIDAVAELSDRWPGLVLAIAGGGDLEAELRTRAADRQVSDRIRFVGVLPHHDVPSYLAAADLVVVPSVVDEAGNVDGLPNIVMEAMASGASLIATTAGGIPSVVASGRTGVLVPPADAGALASAMEALFRNPERRLEMGRLAREDARHRYSWEEYVSHLDEVYSRAVEHRAGAR